jgi:hypothetical protein
MARPNVDPVELVRRVDAELERREGIAFRAADCCGTTTDELYRYYLSIGRARAFVEARGILAYILTDMLCAKAWETAQKENG